MPNSESEMIRSIRDRAQRKRGAIAIGIGDDCAVLRPRAGEDLVVTTDLSLEGTHFLLDRHPPRSVGHRCLARGLSDVAAMGARPLAAFLSLALPADTPEKWIDEFLSGFLALADRYDTTLAGGDVSQSRSGIVADVMLIGSTKRGRAVLRSAARPNDIIYVTGALGGSAAILDVLLAGNQPARSERSQRHFFPEPRVQVGAFLARRKLARAMIDCSDGLSIDLRHICEESGVGAIIHRDLVPVAPGASLEQALHGGEDYELIFTAAPKAKIPVEIEGVPITEIGWITRAPDRKPVVYLTDVRTQPQPLEPRGWQHFRNKP